MSANEQTESDRDRMPESNERHVWTAREFHPPVASNLHIARLLLIIAGLGVCILIPACLVIGTIVVSVQRAAVAAREAEAQQLRERQERDRIEAQAQLELAKKRNEQALQQAEELEKRRASNARLLAERETTRQAEALATKAESEKFQRQRAEEQAMRERQEQERSEQVRLDAESLGLVSDWMGAIARGTADDLLFPYGTQSGNGLSWRVHLLPLAGHQELYKRFELDEPWDSPHNLALLPEIPSFYYHRSDKPGHTRLRSFLRLDGPVGERTKIGDITDGLLNTAAVFMVRSAKTVPWTRPDSLDAPPQVLTREDLALTAYEPAQFFWCAKDAYWSTLPAESPALAAIASPSGGELFLRDTPCPPKFLGPRNSSKLVVADRDEELREAERRMTLIATGIRKVLEHAAANPQLAAQLAGSQLSWRVHLLPYIGEEELYRRFQLDRPWNDPRNLELVAANPDVFQFQTTSGRTRFRMFKTPQPPDQGSGSLPPVSWLADAWESTTLAYYAAPQLAAIWTRPDGSEALLLDEPQFSMGWKKDSSVIAATAEGTVLRLPHDLHISKWHAFVSWRGKDDFDVIQALKSPSRPVERVYRSEPPTPIVGDIRLPTLQAPAPRPAEAILPEDIQNLTKLRSICYAILNYQESFRRSPAQVSASNGAASGLSWRVHVLPFLGQEPLYREFKLDEAWDSPSNIELLKQLPDCYRTSASVTEATSFCLFSGPQSLMGARNWMRVPDGIQHTAMLVQVPSTVSIPWTKPQDIEVVEGLKIRDLAIKGLVRLGMGDGEARLLSSDLPAQVFSALLTCQGGELIDADAVSRASSYLRGKWVSNELTSSLWENQRLKRIALAMHAYESVFRVLPPARVVSARTQPSALPPVECCTLSWRVHILPFLGYEQLFRQFRLNEPWDSPHNKQLLHLMPDCYRGVNDPTDSDTTRIMVFSGSDTIFPEAGRALKLSTISDGVASSILFFQAPKEIEIPWTEPADFQLESPSLESLAKLKSTKGLKVSMCDGSILTLPPDIQPKTLQALITPRGGEVVSSDDLRR